MRNHNRDQTVENQNYPSKELIHRLTDRLLKIKAYKEKKSIGDQIDVRGLFKNADYRRDFLLDMMESGDPKLRQLAKNAFAIDREIQRTSATHIAHQEEVVIDQSSGSIIPPRKIHEEIFVRQKEKDIQDEPIHRERPTSDAPPRNSGPEIMVLNEVLSPETVHDEDSNLPNVITEACPVQKYDQIIAQHEHTKVIGDVPDKSHKHEKEDSDREDEDAVPVGVQAQTLMTYGIIAALVLMLVLVGTASNEEGGHEETAEEAPSEHTATSSAQPWAPTSAPAASTNTAMLVKLPALLPLSALDPLAQDVLRIHGSHAVEEELVPMLVANYLTSRGATDIKYISVNPHDKILQGKLPGRKLPVAIEMESHESSQAFSDLDEDKASIGVAGRPVSESEVSILLDRYGNLHSPAGEHIIGLDGLAIIVNRSNPIEALTMDQVAGLFSGGISDWSQVGGGTGPVNIHVRDEKAGTWDTFRYLILDRNNQRLAANYKRFESDAQLSDSVASDAGGIGFVRLPYVRSTKALPIADAASTQPIMPTHFNVETEEYPLSRRLYMYTSPRQHQRMIDELVYFVTSPEGQAIVEKTDFIPQRVYKIKPLPLEHATPDYQALTKDAERLSLNFYFLPGHIDLDTKGVNDIPRVASYLATHPPKEMLLIGFTDNQGKKQQNDKLSAKRAEVVARRFHEYGLSSTIIEGLGESMPIAKNDTEFGRHRNRRVEIWVK